MTNAAASSAYAAKTLATYPGVAEHHISFTVGGRVFSRTVMSTMNGAHAHMDLLSEQAENEVNADRRARGLGMVLATNCKVRKVERIEPDVRAHMAQARAHGAVR